MVGAARWHSSRTVRVGVAIGLAVLGAVLVWAALVKPSTSESALGGGSSEPPLASPSVDASTPTSEPSTRRTGEHDLRDKVTGLVLPESDPVALSIPKIGVHSKLVELRLKGDGEMDTPEPDVAGWFTQGAAPGALGPAVIAGHVTWNRPAVFYRLKTLRQGDQVSVSRKDGKTAVFTVSRVDRFSKSRFPTRAVYGPIDHAGLRLITCDGTYDAATRAYPDNTVVFARLTAVRG
jgi:hypothetical protein